MVTFSSIVGHPVAAAVDLEMVEEGRDYIRDTTGRRSLHSICTDDWSVLDELGEQAARVRVEYFLTQLPVPGTIEVEVVTDVGNYWKRMGWTYNATRNSVTLSSYPTALGGGLRPRRGSPHALGVAMVTLPVALLTSKRIVDWSLAQRRDRPRGRPDLSQDKVIRPGEYAGLQVTARGLRSKELERPSCEGTSLPRRSPASWSALHP